MHSTIKAQIVNFSRFRDWPKEWSISGLDYAPEKIATPEIRFSCELLSGNSHFLVSEKKRKVYFVLSRNIVTCYWEKTGDNRLISRFFWHNFNKEELSSHHLLQRSILMLDKALQRE